MGIWVQLVGGQWHEDLDVGAQGGAGAGTHQDGDLNAGSSVGGGLGAGRL